jgi:glycine/D-amino acid oxidase-like deaminating enzyme/nitrite reductase/ring-hydroxylating ferredoxin subunit
MPLVSVWQAAHPRHPAVPPDIDGHVDVVVVGGGLTGVTTSLLLGRAGKSVLLLEARYVGAGTTGGSTAKVSVLQGTQLSRISHRHSREVVGQYVTANLEAQAWLARFCDEHEVTTQVRPAYTYGTTRAGARAVGDEHAAAVKAGLPVSWVTDSELPFEITGAVLLPDQLQVDPLDLLEALSLEAARHGVRIVEGARVQKVRGRSPCRVETEAGTVTADSVVLATNMPILDRGGYFARLKPARSYGLAYRTPAPAVAGMYISADGPTRSLRDGVRDDGAMLLVGGEGHTTGRGGSTTRRLDTLREWTAEHFPATTETHAWSAQDYTPAHALPVVGPLLPGLEEIVVAGGFSKWGMTNGVAAALALSSRLLGGHTDWADAMASWSRHELTGLPEGARVNAEVGVEMTRGWLRPLGRPGLGPAPAEGAGVVRYDRLGTPTAQSRVGGVESRVSAVCTHLGGIVSWNDAERSWDCPLHGSRFGPDGEVLEGPATCGLAAR